MPVLFQLFQTSSFPPCIFTPNQHVSRKLRFALRQSLLCGEYSKSQSKETEGQSEQCAEIKESALPVGYRARQGCIFHYLGGFSGHAFEEIKTLLQRSRSLSPGNECCVSKLKMPTDALIRGVTCMRQAF